MPFVQIAVPVLAAIVASVVTWKLTQLSHRKEMSDQSAATLQQFHRVQQIEVLVELQNVLLEYYEVFSLHLWTAWEVQKRSLRRGLKQEADEAWQKMDALALRLFALSSRVDDLKIRSMVDYVEEIARDATASPGKHYLGTTETISSKNVMEDDRSIQNTVVALNLDIGNRILELAGSTNPELTL